MDKITGRWSKIQARCYITEAHKLTGTQSKCNELIQEASQRAQCKSQINMSNQVRKGLVAGRILSNGQIQEQERSARNNC